MTVRVLLADDHPIFLEGLRTMLETVDGIEVVGVASNGAELLELAARIEADVAVVDLDMPVLDGAGAAAELIERQPGVAVMALTMHADEEAVLRALRAGVRGYLLKSSGPAGIARALAAVAEGDVVLSGRVGAMVARAALRTTTDRPFAQLSGRETEILDHVARGRSNPEIARALFLSVKTVQNHVSAILSKLDVSSRAEAVARARDAGLGTGPASGGVA
ncbi:DNA-binding response regulator [Planotetraspora thailandica]|uniref:DNA-binding response regulator n=1 Tax=Planotetraspora thailandica TaxID=487172 RepID=A0A8J3XYS0_9ACTN|nr:response regulator transcription factor [Planotetraspora thailandica]GII57815.1 DNA-binding response regulator [Planotetraspora thailandica]